MPVQDYTVRLDTFQGPLDLLLHLIQRAEVDITEVSIAHITDQFLSHIDDLDERVDVDTAGEFLVLAATLIEIKSRVLTPDESKATASSEEGAESNDLAGELIRQLLAYKAFRDAADRLDDQRAEWLRRYPAGQAAIDRGALTAASGADAATDLEDVELYDLVTAFGHIMETVVFDRLGAHEITDDDTPIELHAADIVDRLDREPGGRIGGEGIALRVIFEGRSRSEMVGLFLALLELTRQHRCVVRQDPDRQSGDPGSDIVIALREPEKAEHVEDSEDRIAAIDDVAPSAAWEDDHIFGEDEEPDDDDDEPDAH
ncbi:MAG: segregation/condensation protein A [Planctomycetota bacterium]